MTKNVAFITFADSAQTYQAWSQLKDSPVGNVVSAGTILERGADGSVKAAEGGDLSMGGGLAGGSLIGMLVGALGGPLGMLLGWGVGALAGGAVDADRADSSDATLLSAGGSIPPGGNALLLETNEDDTSALDGFVAERGGVIVRRLEDDVIADLEAEEEAAKAAQKAANDTMKAQRKAERHDKREDRLAKLKAKFHKN